MSEQYFSDRALGQYPLSIATSLAIESACGIHPEIQVKSPPVLEYDQIWINIKTLYRNFMGALDSYDAGTISPEAVGATLLQEMDQIESIIKGVSSRTSVVFYVCNYDDLELKYRYATVRKDTSEKQKVFTRIYDSAIKSLTGPDADKDRFKIFPRKLKPEGVVKVMLISHIAYDLLSASAFSEMVLLESHTGKIKERGQWYTKFYNGKDLPMIPFNEGFLQVFGDTETFRPQDSRFRKAIIEIAEKYKWSQLTTKAKLSYGIDQLANPYYKEVLRQII